MKLRLTDVTILKVRIEVRVRARVGVMSPVRKESLREADEREE